MKRVLLTAMFVMAFYTAAFGQHGSAPAGYYAMGYSGDTWTGEVVSTDDTTREITLTYTNGKKSATFTGVLKDKLQVKMKDGSMKELKPSSIPKGARITAFYQAKTKKVDGNKVKYYEIFQISRVNGASGARTQVTGKRVLLGPSMPLANSVPDFLCYLLFTQSRKVTSTLQKSHDLH